MEIIKIGNVELTEEEAVKLCSEGKFLITYSKIYQLVSDGKRIHGKVIYTQRGLARRGRYYAFTGKEINHLLKMELVKGV